MEKRRPKCFSDEETSQIMKSVFTAVKYIHEKEIVHRDIKPGLCLELFWKSKYL